MHDILSLILDNIDALTQSNGRLLVAIDGRCASGKTSTAAALQAARGWPVIHMDQFFLRPEQRSAARYAVPGENIDHERFLQEVLLPLRSGKAAAYRPFSCHSQQLEPPISLPDSPVYIIEGSYSCHPLLRQYYDLRIFLTVDPQTQAERILVRNGPEYAQVFRDKWIPLEERYFAECDVLKHCDLCYTT